MNYSLLASLTIYSISIGAHVWSWLLLIISRLFLPSGAILLFIFVFPLFRIFILPLIIICLLYILILIATIHFPCFWLFHFFFRWTYFLEFSSLSIFRSITWLKLIALRISLLDFRVWLIRLFGVDQRILCFLFFLNLLYQLRLAEMAFNFFSLNCDFSRKLEIPFANMADEFIHEAFHV